MAKLRTPQSSRSALTTLPCLQSGDAAAVEIMRRPHDKVELAR